MAITTLGSVEYNTVQSQLMDVCKITPAIFAIAHSGDDGSINNAGMCDIILLNGSGVPSVAATSPFVFDANSCGNVMKIIKYDDTHLIVAYTDTTTPYLRVKFLAYNESTHELSIAYSNDIASNGTYPAIRVVNNDYLLMGYKNGSNTYLKLYKINTSTYELTEKVNYPVGSSGGGVHDIKELEENIYSLLHSDVVNSKSSIFEIDTTPLSESITFRCSATHSSWWYPTLSILDSLHFIVCGADKYSPYYGKAVGIYLDKTDPNAWILTSNTEFTFESSHLIAYTTVTEASRTRCVVAYGIFGAGIYPGKIVSLAVSNDDNLTISLDGTPLQFESIFCTYVSIIGINAYDYILAYTGSDTDGWCQTFNVYEFSGWLGYINGVTNPNAVNGLTSSEINEINGIGSA